MYKDIYYIVCLKDEYVGELKLTTIRKRFCGKFIHQSHGNLYFELNGSSALVVVPEKWIEYVAPSKVMANKYSDNHKIAKLVVEMKGLGM